MDVPATKVKFLQKVRIPAWLGSIFFHLVVLLLILFYLWLQPAPASAPGERTATGGIVLKQDSQDGESFIDSDNNQHGEASPETGNEALQAPTLEQVVAGEFSDIRDLKQALPNPAIGPQSRSVSGQNVPSAADMIGNLKGGSQTAGLGYELGGKASVRLFGAEGKGSSFVYVFDQSGSMDEYGGKPMQAAKNNLVKSFESLGKLHKFNLIFYNEKPYVWKPNKMVFADDVNKAGAIKYVQGIIPRGGTKHYPALMEAMRLNPEIIFFLTDGDENDRLRPGELEEIDRRNGRIGAQINVIQFGVGENRQAAFLRNLAARNRGQYVYINVSELR